MRIDMHQPEMFTAIFESLVLGVKSGAKAETLFEVFS